VVSQTLSGTGARVYTAHRDRLGVVTGISAASNGGVLVIIHTGSAATRHRAAFCVVFAAKCRTTKTLYVITQIVHVDKYVCRVEQHVV